jgi:hypothetical protein
LVFRVGDRLQPGGAVTVWGAFEHGDVAHEVVGGAAVPVLFALRLGVPRRCRLESQPDSPTRSLSEHTQFGMTGVRREALRYIPGSAGRDWRDVLGSDGLPGAERLRGQEHARKTVAGSRYQGRCAGRPARYGES